MLGMLQEKNVFLKLIKNQEVLKGSFPHNHDKMKENQMERQKLSNILKRKTTENISGRSIGILNSHVLFLILKFWFGPHFLLALVLWHLPDWTSLGLE